MFERFTDRARLVVVQAQEEARTLDHNYVGPEHLLLGLTHNGIGGAGARALESLGIGLEAVRQRVEEIIGRGEQAPSGHIPFTPRAKEVLKLALRKPSSSAIATSAPSTSCSASSVRATAWLRRY
jgi:ATP-dependent Clp protease ATP-binding subunit ClpC